MSARDTVTGAIRAIAPELDDADLTDDAHLQQDLDLDSMDFLDVVTELCQRTGLAIPEADYPQLATVGACTAYVEQHATAA